MEGMENSQKKQLLAYQVSTIVLAVLLVIAVIFSFRYSNRAGRLSDEKDQLIAQVDKLKSDLSELNESLYLKDAIIAEKDTLIDQLRKEHASIIEEKDRRIANLGWRVNTRSKELEEANEKNVLLVAENDALATQQDLLNDELARLRQELNTLTSVHEQLLQQVELTKELKVYNMNLLTKWERRICPDRYNVSKARRVDYTFINFEIDGTVFTETGTKNVHLVMTDPMGEIMNATSDLFVIKDSGYESAYTDMQQINYDNTPVLVEFNILHPERLMAGTYQINAYVDGVLSRTKEMVLE